MKSDKIFKIRRGVATVQDQGLEPRGSAIFNIWREEDPTKHTENQQLVT